MSFTQLHCHTEYSLLDGAIRLKDLCAKAKDFGFDSVCITDHGNLFGALSFYLLAKDFGLKPIIGCEVYVAPGKMEEKSSERYHLVLLAKDLEGYKNLIKIVTLGWRKGFYYKPRVDKETLFKYNKGLIALSACLKGEVQDAYLKFGPDKAVKIALEYSNIFPNRFYLEMQANGIKEQDEVNEFLYELSKKEKLPIVATNDCHYLNKDDFEAHDVLLCIQTNAKVTDTNRMRFNTKELYFKSFAEMQEYFSFCPEAFDYIDKITEECNLELELNKHYFPRYDLPEGVTLEDEFERLAKEGLKKRLSHLNYVQDESIYWKRLEREIEVISQKGFPGYFLIVQDFINWAKKQGILVGPGRGSAAGSLVAYALGITNLDPIRYNLLFERFLNVERTSLPDIDVDFCDERRDEVIQYVTQKYGKDNVAQITTFGTMKAKAAVRDVGRALGFKLSFVDKIAKLIPDDLKMTIEKALELEPELKKLEESDERVKKLLTIAQKLEGLARHASTHAAGVVISDKPMWEYLPLYVGKKGEVVTQFDMKRVEKIGLIKFDFLALKTLTVIENTLKLARQNGKQIPDLEKIPLDDAKTFALLSKGQTDGIFQLESSGMRKVLQDLKPSCFEDIIAILALYRPGPLQSGMVADFIERKHGRKKVEYPHPALENILKETYGVILYQEQVMQIASVLASYSLGDGDILRRAMGKKDPAVMAKQRSKFLDGAKKNGVDEKIAEYIFDLMEKFAGYGFNKSHSAAYALVSWQTAYLKAHFPAEFMAALITSEVQHPDKVIFHLNAVKEMNIEVLPPDINKSYYYFSVEGEKIRFGLGAIKNVGKSAIDAIIEEREKNGPYKTFLDFCERVNLRKVTKRVIEMLIKSGAMDCFGCTRKALLTGMQKVISRAQHKKDNGYVQKNLLGMGNQLEESNLSGLGINIPEQALEEFIEKERLKLEKESLGLYLSGHPLGPYKRDLPRLGIVTIRECENLPPKKDVKIAAICVKKKIHINKKNQKMAFCQIEDFSGSCELTIFQDVLDQSSKLLDQDDPLYIEAKISNYEGNLSLTEGQEEDETKTIKLLANKIMKLQDVIFNNTEPLMINLPYLEDQNIVQEVLDKLKKLFLKYKGNNEVNIRIACDKFDCILKLNYDWKVSPDDEFWLELDKICKDVTEKNQNIVI
ncbi:MAG: DNA polymerase III subunit alpha [Desulfonauticus sp.]|nr:DNA polymerase III subunit alpha [Desulfonauticus sp.]